MMGTVTINGVMTQFRVENLKSELWSKNCTTLVRGVTKIVSLATQFLFLSFRLRAKHPKARAKRLELTFQL